MNKSPNIFLKNSLNSLKIQCGFKSVFIIIILYYIKYVQFFKNHVFLFSPIWLCINLCIYFYDVVNMVIIHKKIATFGYR
jgi:hypothetical protein